MSIAASTEASTAAGPTPPCPGGRGLAGRRVLVTGADGFIGSHLVERLVADGAKVRALALYNGAGSHGWLDDLEPTVRDDLDLRLGDVRDAEAVRGLVRGVDVVFHLAALISVPYSYEAPASFVATNVVGTLAVLDAARDAGVERVVHTSTSEVYGTPAVVPITEDHPLRAQSPYAASKVGADKLCEAYAASFGLPVVVLRPFNTYGPRQSLRAVIAAVVRQLLEPGASVRLGSLHPRRDFTYVDDTVDGFVRAAVADLEPGEVVQLGTGTTISVGDLVDLAAKVVGVEATVEVDDTRVRPPGSEVEVLVSDPARAARRLGWRPRTSLEDGLTATAAWLSAHLDRFPDARSYHR